MTKRINGETPAAEWVVALTGALIILSVLGLLLYEAAVVDTPPDLHVQVASVTKIGAGFRVGIKVMNTGTATAASVHVRGELHIEDRVVEQVEMVIDYVAGGSAVAAAFQLDSDPARGTLRVRAVGYQDP